MRFVIYGAGAIGGVVGARLFQHGHEVVLIARGAHHDALQARGLRVQDPSGEERLPIPVVDHPATIDWRRDDVVLVAVKSQHSPEVLAALAAVAPPELAVVCLQNGVRNEPEALRRFANVYTNLGNVVEAVCGPAARRGPIRQEAIAEGQACLAVAGIEPATTEEDQARRAELLQVHPVAGESKPGGSSWQSLHRRAPGIETDYLTGEVVLLGRLHGVATPVNALLQHLANRLAITGGKPGSITPNEFNTLLMSHRPAS